MLPFNEYPDSEKKSDLDLNEALAEIIATGDEHTLAHRPPPLFSASQKTAITQLETLYKLRLLNPSAGGLKVRTHALLAGPSGAGKTTAVQLFTDRAGIPFLTISVGSWTILNARNEPSTLQQIHAFTLPNLAHFTKWPERSA